MSAAAASIIEVSKLSVTRDHRQILRGVSWKMQPGEFWVILGANGCGKSTLLNVISGFSAPSAGSIRVLGEEFGDFDWRELRKHVGLVSATCSGMVAQDELALDVVATGEEALFDTWYSPTLAKRKAARNYLKMTDSDHLGLQTWATLSQGERQRVLIARALSTHPQLLVLDEPCAGLDPVARNNFLHFLGQLARKKNATPMILVTHHVEEIIPEVSHALVIKNGKTLQAGPVKEVLTSKTLSTAFRAKITLHGKPGNWTASVERVTRRGAC